MTNTNITRTILWILAVAYGVALIANISFGLSIPIAIVLLVSVAFALVHGSVRYGWSGIAVEALGSKVRSHMTIRKEAMKGTAKVVNALAPRL